MRFRQWQQYEKVWVAGGGQTVINSIILYIFITIVAKGDLKNPTVSSTAAPLSENKIIKVH